jgi:hypothetical protein
MASFRIIIMLGDAAGYGKRSTKSSELTSAWQMDVTLSEVAASPDSQSMKTTEIAGERGFDAGKKVKGRKRRYVIRTVM